MRASDLDCDAMVVGGGPAGAAAAARLAARGCTTILIDRATFPRDKVCGDFVGPAALAELAELGVTGTEAFGATNVVGDCALHVDGHQLGSLAIPEVDGLPAYGRIIPRKQLDAWILDAARQAGATVLDGRKVTVVQRTAGGVTVYGQSAAGPWQLRTRLLLGADGSNSMVARTLRGSTPPHQDRILAVRAYFDNVSGPADRADICVGSDSFPGYGWLFPCGHGLANVGVGMVVSTYPQTGRNLRELLLRLIAEDASMRDRLQGARIRGKILGCPLSTYNPRLPLVGDRMMLVGDAAGLINPLNGEGIQYALHSARWAADIAADRLSSDQLDTAALAGYAQYVQHGLRLEMASSRFIVQLIRNRALTPFWLRVLGNVADRVGIDPDYAYRAGCVVTGLAPASRALGLGVAAKTARQTMITPRRRKLRGPARHTLTPREFADWAAGVGRELIEVTTQLTRARLTRTSARRPYP